MTQKRSISQVLVMALVLVTGSFYAKHAAAQNGGCVIQYTVITVPCHVYQCNDSVLMLVPVGGYGSGVWFYGGNSLCCGNYINTLASRRWLQGWGGRGSGAARGK